MNAGPYRTSISPSSPHDGGTGCVSATQSVRSHSSVSFIPMPGMDRQHCVDMYGDIPFGLFVLPDSTLRGEAAYIFTNEGTPILEQNADFLRKKRFLKPRLTEEHLHLQTAREVDDIVSLTSRCDTGFFHWMMDSLPKVILAEACGFTGSYLIPPSSTAPWAEESLNLLGISTSRLIPHSSLDTRASRLFIPTYFSGYNAHHNKQFMKLYRDKVRRTISIEPRRSNERILIARKPETKVRRIINHDEVRTIAEQFGFQTVYFEDLSFHEQLERALSAEAMIGAHGSGLCHSLFMGERSTLIELFPFARKQSCDCYERIATIPEHRYYALESEQDCEGDVRVSPDTLMGVLRQALAR